MDAERTNSSKARGNADNNASDENCDNYSDSEVSKLRTGLFSITGNLKTRKIFDRDKVNDSLLDSHYGETATSTESIETAMQATKSIKRKRMTSNNGPTTPVTSSDYVLHNNNNNHVKNERLSPSTPDTSSRSRSVTPSSASHPDTPPASENPLLPVTGRNYSDFMRSLAAKYNNSNPNDYFSASRGNGSLPALPPGFRPSFPASLLPPATAAAAASPSKDGGGDAIGGAQARLPLGPFAAAGAALFPPLIDMSTTQALLAMVRTAKEAELQGLLKNAKRSSDPASPLDLSAAAVAPPSKRLRTKPASPAQLATPSAVQATPTVAQATPKRSGSASPRSQDDIASWGVEDVANFVAGIDICSEYAQMFREQRIDGSGLPMLTEEHLTTTMNMKLGPALKLRSILAKKLGSCSVCLHCSHCHNSGSSPEPANSTGNTSDSGGTS